MVSSLRSLMLTLVTNVRISECSPVPAMELRWYEKMKPLMCTNVLTNVFCEILRRDSPVLMCLSCALVVGFRTLVHVFVNSVDSATNA